MPISGSSRYISKGSTTPRSSTPSTPDDHRSSRPPSDCAPLRSPRPRTKTVSGNRERADTTGAGSTSSVRRAHADSSRLLIAPRICLRAAARLPRAPRRTRRDAAPGRAHVPFAGPDVRRSQGSANGSGSIPVRRHTSTPQARDWREYEVPRRRGDETCFAGPARLLQLRNAAVQDWTGARSCRSSKAQPDGFTSASSRRDTRAATLALSLRERAPSRRTLSRSRDLSIAGTRSADYHGCSSRGRSERPRPAWAGMGEAMAMNSSSPFDRAAVSRRMLPVSGDARW